MVGLRTRENLKFLKYFTLIQDEASKLGKTFFLDCGEGNEYQDDEIECETLSGWLIDNENIAEFENLFINRKLIGEKWNDFVVFVDWKIENGKIEVSFDYLDFMD